MPYGEVVSVQIGEVVRIHNNYETYKFNKVEFGKMYYVKQIEDGKIKQLRSVVEGFWIDLNMDIMYFTKVGGEMEEDNIDFERNYSLEIGDVVLIQNPGHGFVKRDVGKHVEVIGKGSYFGGLS